MNNIYNISNIKYIGTNMPMHKILISIPDELAYRLRHTIPARLRSKVISELIAKEIELREKKLYACALELENDKALTKEMKDWNITVADGLDEVDHESW